MNTNIYISRTDSTSKKKKKNYLVSIQNQTLWFQIIYEFTKKIWF